MVPAKATARNTNKLKYSVRRKGARNRNVLEPGRTEGLDLLPDNISFKLTAIWVKL